MVHWDGKWPSAMLLGDRIVWAKGTLSRQAQIKAFLGRKRALVRWYAWLVREPTNPHDPNAIAVYLGQHHVGYLAAPIAKAFAPQVDALRLGDGHPSCLCTIKTVPDGALLVGLIGPWPRDESTSEGWVPPGRRRKKASDDDEPDYDEEFDEEDG